MKVVILAGGTSTERDVSLVSGKMIYEALIRKEHQAVLLDVYVGYEDNDYASVFEMKKDWAKSIGKISAQAPDLAAVKSLRKDNGKGFFGPHVLDICQEADIVFLGLHGANGEDGKIQAALELAGIPYTGSSFLGAAISMDKSVSKELFIQNGIPTPIGFSLKKEEYEAGETGFERISMPAVVKTCCGGSSVGVYITQNEEEYKTALKEAFAYEPQVVIEQYIKGREFSIGIIDGEALPLIEIAPIEGFYNYKNKYQAGSAVETCPAQLDADITKKMQSCAEKVFKTLRLEAYARMDFIMDENGEFFCLEANTLPGMTQTSLLPQEALAVGISYEELCEKIIEISLKKYL